MATIRKRGNKFQVQVRRASFQSATKSFERLTEDKAWARQCEILCNKGDYVNQKPSRIRLADILGRYLKEVKPAKKSAAGEARRINYLLKNKFNAFNRFQKYKGVQDQSLCSSQYIPARVSIFLPFFVPERFMKIRLHFPTRGNILEKEIDSAKR